MWEGVAVDITNIISGEIKEYATLTLAGIASGVSRTAVRNAMQSSRALKNTYLIKLKNKN